MSDARWSRWLTLLVPERELDAAGRAELDAEMRALNIARLKAWWLPLIGLQTLFMVAAARMHPATPLVALWQRDLLRLYTVLEFSEGLVALCCFFPRGPAAALAARTGPILNAVVLLVFALLGANAQRFHGSLGPYFGVLVSSPYLARARSSWYYATMAAGGAVLVAGVWHLQPSPALRASAVLAVPGFTAFAVVVVRMYTATVVSDLRSRRALRQLNGELEARVDAQTHELRGFATRLDGVLEAERRRLARDLHDDLGQELTAMRLEVEALRARAREEAQRDGLGRVSAAIERSHHGVRVILESLRPRILDEDGLEAAVRWLARQFRERTGRACDVTVALPDEPGAAAGLVVFRVAQEALTNVARHADATRVTVALREHGEALVLTVEDDGRGLPAARAEGRHGLVGMRERVAAAGGELDVASVEPRGTRVRASVPRSA